MGDNSSTREVSPRRFELRQRNFSSKQAPLNTNNIASASTINLQQQQQQQQHLQIDNIQRDNLPQSIVKKHTSNIYHDRATQTDLDMSKLKEQDTISAVEDSRLEDLQQAIDDDLAERLLQNQEAREEEKNYKQRKLSGRLRPCNPRVRDASTMTDVSNIHRTLDLTTGAPQTRLTKLMTLHPIYGYCLTFTALCLVALALYFQQYIQGTTIKPETTEGRESTINLEHIDNINNRYPGLLSSKKLRTIKARIGVMNREVSKLMLLGKSRDSHCNIDPTFCVGQTIANVTQVQFGYIDASDPHLQSDEIELELKKSLEGDRYTMMIDSLEKMPPSEVMNLFQFIDKDETLKRRGMLIFILYTGSVTTPDNSKMKESEIAENILIERWSPIIPKDSLSSVISRISGSIIKIN